jgi:phosphate starvation-inducible PhoH-like protein
VSRRNSHAKKVLTFAADADNDDLANVTGPLDANIRQVETELDVAIARRGHQFRVEGPAGAAQSAVNVLEHFLDRARRTGRPVSVDDIQLYFVEQRGGREETSPADGEGRLQLHTRRSDLHGRTARQRDYIAAMLEHDITISIGPAGTGKTYLAVAAAVDALERDIVQRIVLTRPAVEAGERLGFLPGDLAQKVDP